MSCCMDHGRLRARDERDVDREERARVSGGKMLGAQGRERLFRQDEVQA